MYSPELQPRRRNSETKHHAQNGIDLPLKTVGKRLSYNGVYISDTAGGTAMDRRQKKTRKAIFDAFSELIQEKNYNDITIQDIIDRADIGRSTFYSHFHTKDEMLDDMCSHIFRHISADHENKEDTHDFSGAPNTLRDMLTHLLYHLREHKDIVSGMMLSVSHEIFIRYLDEYLDRLFRGFLIRTDGVPEEYLLDQAISGFSGTVRWWAMRDMSDSPEEICAIYASSHPWLRFDTDCLNGHHLK
jgi:AcrR family transcriptional regulator